MLEQRSFISQKPSRREQIYQAVYALLDDYYRFGFLYDEDGKVKERYYCPCGAYQEDGSNGPLVDSMGVEMTRDLYLEPECMLDPYLDVHRNQVFDELDWKDLQKMSVYDIYQNFLKYSMPQLIAMLRRGYNYALKEPVTIEAKDGFLVDAICFTWKMMVMDTLNNHAVKQKFMVADHRYYEKGKEMNYSWDERPFANRLHDSSDIVKVIPAKINLEDIFSEEFKEASRKAEERQMQKEEEILTVLWNSFTEEEFEQLPMNRIAKALLQ